MNPRLALVPLAVACCAALMAVPGRVSGQSALELEGLWAAKLRFGPDIRGTLRIEHDNNEWIAEIAGISADAQLDKNVLTFEFPGERGGFRGHLDSSRQRIIGHWIQAPTQNSGSRYASPITLQHIGKSERWEGVIDPLEDEFTMYLKVDRSADGSMRAFLKNPERNIGKSMQVATLERDGKVIRLRGWPSGNEEGRVLSEGTLVDDVMSIPLRGGTYDFRRVAPGAASDFYPRSRPGTGEQYRYRTPPALDDGWPVATPEDVGISRQKLEAFIRMLIDMPIDSVGSPEIHTVLIARHGRLVLEEYFHGEHRDKPHDTRSASKSVMAVLAGAAIQSGVKLSADSHVYQVMNGGEFPQGLEPRKRAMTLEHLLTMSSGFDCDDSDPDSPGAEDRMAEQTLEPDLWKLTLALGMIREPGDKAVYCSIQPNLAGGMVRRAAGRPVHEVFHDLVAGPLQINRYWMNLMRSGEAYMGGGTRFLPRDFMKFGQMMLNGGVWNNRRVISEEWARRSASPRVEIGNRKYGYLWWMIDYTYQQGTIHAYHAGGNGGQIVVVVPELDLVVTFFGGNYADRATFYSQRTLVPEFVLPAVVAK
jgi:CubicO group peptidase (beta-lactamase class C family)